MADQNRSVIFSIYDVVSKKARTSCSKLKNDPIFSYLAFQMATTFHSYVLELYRIVGVWHLNSYVFLVPAFFLSRVPNGALA
jgi:hypothetical protein